MPIFKFHKIVLAIAFIIYFVTAVNSKGYFHFDEHYQIIEFANLKTGLNKPSDLAWEYNAEIRPSIQPAVSFAVFKILHWLGITDVYILSLSLRLITLLLALITINLFVLSSLNLVQPKFQKLYILLSYFLWFLPFLNVRFSSETWSGLCFLLAVAILQLNLFKRKSFFALVGLLLGLSFLCRFQSAVLILGLFSWLIIINKEPLKNLFFIIGAACAVLLFGGVIDYWFYEHAVFTAWNYFNTNIVQGVASEFGTSSWNYYAGTILKGPTVFIGVLLLLCLCTLIYKKPRLLLLWLMVPFLVVHSIIPHKEDRFLFPIINFIPLLIALGWQEISVLYQSKLQYKIYRLFAGTYSVLFIIVNVFGLITMASKPMGIGYKAITYYIHNNYKGKAVNLFYDDFSNPYNPLYSLPLKEPFYSDKNVREINLQQSFQNGDPIYNDKINLFVFEKGKYNALIFDNLIMKYHLKLKTQSIPIWIEKLDQYYNFFDDRRILLLYSNK